MSISEILKDVVQGNGWAYILDECKQTPDRWIDIYEALIKQRDFFDKKRLTFECKIVACKIINVTPDANIAKSLRETEAVIKDVEGAIKDITDYYIPKPAYEGEIVCLPERVYKLLPLDLRDVYCIEENLTGLDKLNINIDDNVSKQPAIYNEDLLRLFKGNSSLIDELKGMSDDDIAYKIKAFAKKGLVENPENNQKTAFAKCLKEAGLIKCSERTFRDKL